MGIYFHIPFCRKACTYCDFHFSTSLGTKEAVLAAMHSELEHRAHEVPKDPIGTIYFGGGTPSLLEPTDIGDLMRAVHARFAVAPDAEVTLEANPDDITSDRLQAWKDMGITRSSLGIQSFREERLRFMGRAHTALDALRSIDLIAKAGFRSWTMDLIYGLPDMTMEEWDAQLTIALDHGMPHLSAYCLTVEPRTALAHQVLKGKVKMPDDADQSAQFEQLIQRMEQAGLQQYEISNFGRPGHFAVHNTSYWKGTPYLGIGPSAHSFSGTARRWNAAHNVRYAQAVNSGERYWEEELLTAAQRTNEMILTGLRTIWGVTLAELPVEIRVQHDDIIRGYVERGQLTMQDGRIALTRAGRHFADRIAADLFVTDDR